MEIPQAGTRPELSRSTRSALAQFPLDSFVSGMILVHQDSVPENVLVLRGGIVKLIHRFPDGRGAVVGLRGTGSLLGVEAALARRPHPVSVVAVTDCRVHRIGRRRFSAFMRDGGGLSTWVLGAHMAELERQVLQVARLARFDARERLESYFEFVRAEVGVASPGDHAEFELPLRDWELAQLLAVTPSYLSRLIHELQSNGRLVRRGRGHARLREDGAARTSS